MNQSKYAARVAYFHTRTGKSQKTYCRTLEAAQAFFEALRNESWCTAAFLEVRHSYRGVPCYLPTRSYINADQAAGE